ncbi:hypothetical protein [Gaetbulibacter jejuensis]|uniref:Uncharacterized protein n=1 Tax=Gaetbulibacter jejuensis TaxID=584607 RepID=A0ABP3V830_9FLAO
MKSFLKVSVFVIVFVTITIFSKSISKEVVTQYNNCVTFMANNTVASINQ